MSCEQYNLNTVEDSQVKKNNDSSHKYLTKKVTLHMLDNDSNPDDNDDLDECSSDADEFDINNFFQKHDSYFNYQEPFPHDDIDLMLSNNKKQYQNFHSESSNSSSSPSPLNKGTKTSSPDRKNSYSDKIFTKASEKMKNNEKKVFDFTNENSKISLVKINENKDSKRKNLSENQLKTFDGKESANENKLKQIEKHIKSALLKENKMINKPFYVKTPINMKPKADDIQVEKYDKTLNDQFNDQMKKTIPTPKINISVNNTFDSQRQRSFNKPKYQIQTFNQFSSDEHLVQKSVSSQITSQIDSGFNIPNQYQPKISLSNNYEPMIPKELNLNPIIHSNIPVVMNRIQQLPVQNENIEFINKQSLLERDQNCLFSQTNQYQNPYQSSFQLSPNQTIYNSIPNIQQTQVIPNIQQAPSLQNIQQTQVLPSIQQAQVYPNIQQSPTLSISQQPFYKQNTIQLQPVQISSPQASLQTQTFKPPIITNCPIQSVNFDESLQSQIDIQNQIQQSIENMVQSKVIYESSLVSSAMSNESLVLNPNQLKFEPLAYWSSIHGEFTFGELVKNFFRSKNVRISKFIYKLYDLLLITSNIPFYKGIVGVNWVTYLIFSVNVESLAAFLDIPYSSIDSALFGPSGSFTVLGFTEITQQNFNQVGLGSFPNIPKPGFKLMFHLDKKFVNQELSTQILDEIDSHYQISNHSQINSNILVRPKYPGFS